MDHLNASHDEIADIGTVLGDEKTLFNILASTRKATGRIPIEFDYDFEPIGFDFERYSGKLIGRQPVRDYLALINGSRNPKVVDVCCGAGWVSLMSARRGARVKGYDIADVAIEVARRLASEHAEAITKTDGSLAYDVKNACDIAELKEDESVDVVVGWSAFHHLTDIEVFLFGAIKALTPGGHIISIDDLESAKLNRMIAWIFKFILPLKELSYREKINRLPSYVSKLFRAEQEWHTPMERYVGKHSSAAGQIEEILSSRCDVVHNYRYSAFVHYFVYDIAGPDWFKKGVFDVLFALDGVLTAIGVCKGNLRFMAVKKKADHNR